MRRNICLTKQLHKKNLEELIVMLTHIFGDEDLLEIVPSNFPLTADSLPKQLLQPI